MSQRLVATAGIRSWSRSSPVRVAMALLGLVAVGCGGTSRPTEEKLASARQSLISSLTVRLTRIHIGQNAGTGFYTGGVTFTGIPGSTLPIWECRSRPDPPISTQYGDWVPPPEGQITHYCDPPSSVGTPCIGDLAPAVNRTIFSLPFIPLGGALIPVTVSFRDTTGNNSHDFDWNFTVDSSTGAVAAAPIQGNATAATSGPNGEHSCARGPDGWMICWQVEAPLCVPSTEICDGKDNNCNGSVDEQFPFHVTCGAAGACAGTQTFTCVGGVPGATACTGVTAPTPEICDGVDNDCDGVVDETSPEVINGKDDNCDGQIDEGFSPLTCAPGQTDWWCCPSGEVHFPVDQVTAVGGPQIDAFSEDDAAAACLPVGVGSGVGCNLRGVVRRAEQLRQIDGVRPGCAVIAELAPGRHELARAALNGIASDRVDYDRSLLAIAAGNLTLRGMGATPASTVIEPRSGITKRLLRMVTPERLRPPQVTVQNVMMRAGSATEAFQLGGAAILINRGGFTGTAPGLLKLTVEDSIFEGNRASQEGGAIQLWDDESQRAQKSSLLTVRRTLFRHNQSGGAVNSRGGAISVASTTLVLEDSAIVNNLGVYGGGIDVESADMTAVNNTFSGNRCDSTGCGLQVLGGSSPAPEVKLLFNTITENALVTDSVSVQAGPGIAVIGAVNLTAFGNIIANNSFIGPKPNQSPDCSLQVPLAMASVTAAYNLVGVGGLDCGQLGDPAESLIGDSVLAPLNPLLEPLPDAPPPGGVFANVCQAGAEALSSSPCDVVCKPATNAAGCVHALQTNPPGPSPAIDAYPLPGALPAGAPACPVWDQRSTLRPTAGSCDLGSFEVEGVPDADHDGMPDTLDAQPLLFSSDFNDVGQFGLTSGTIVDRGNQTLVLTDAVGLQDGVVITARAGGGTAPARVSGCGGTVNLTLQAGQSATLTCPGAAHSCLFAASGQALTVRDRSAVMSDFFGGSFNFGSDALASGNGFSAGNGSLGDRATVLGNATLAGVLSGNRAGVKGLLREHAMVAAQSITTRPGTSSGPDLTVAAGASTTIQPGTYGAVAVRLGGVLVLAKAGLYRFRSLQFDPDTRLSVMGGSNLTALAVDGTLAFGDRFKMDSGGGPRLQQSQVLLYASGATVNVGFDTALAGTLEAPAAAVTLQDRSTFSGCVAGRSVVVGIDVTVGSGAPAKMCDGTSRVNNPGFEAGTTGWLPSTGATLATTTSRAHTGARSGQVGNRTGAAQGAIYNLLATAPRGATYDVSVWAEPSTTTSQPLTLAARIRCTGGQDQVIQLAQTTGRSTAWTRLAGVLTVPNCPLGALDITAAGPPAGVGLFVDDASVIQRCP